MGGGERAGLQLIIRLDAGRLVEKVEAIEKFCLWPDSLKIIVGSCHCLSEPDKNAICREQGSFVIGVVFGSCIGVIVRLVQLRLSAHKSKTN